MKNNSVNQSQKHSSGVTVESPRPAPEWQWLGNAGHFICSQWCRFHLCTVVNGFLVSTVGELVPDETVRQIHADAHGVTLEGRGDARLADYMRKCGFQEIGYGRTYETMVFLAGEPCAIKECGCRIPALASHELYMEGYNDPANATEGHMKACALAANGEIDAPERDAETQ